MFGAVYRASLDPVACMQSNHYRKEHHATAKQNLASQASAAGAPQHRKTAIFGWLAFVMVLAVVIGMNRVPQKEIDPSDRGRPRRAPARPPRRSTAPLTRRLDRAECSSRAPT